MQLTVWGRYPRVDCELHLPTSPTPACELISGTPSVLARGMGRSYGDAALGDVLLGTRQLDRLRAFDEQDGTLRCDAGVTLAEIVEVAK